MLLFGLVVVCFGTLCPAQGQIAKLSQGIFDHVFPFPPEFDFRIPFDTMFSSWQSSRPDFHMLADLPPLMSVPHVQVVCNSSQLTLLVDKAYGGVLLSGDDLLLGDGCNVTGDLENQFVFTYDLTQCGTSRVVQSGFEIFSNFLHVKPSISIFNGRPTPFTLALSCTPNMLPHPPSFPFPVGFPREGCCFAMKLMNALWTHAAKSTIYERGHNMHFQVTAKAGPDQQPFIQTCFVSMSPDPHFRPRQTLVLNKGCASVSKDSGRALAEFVSPTTDGAINLVVDTSTLTSGVFIHCSVLMSSFGVTPGSKSCNYNKIQSRWEELNGNVEVCSCCSTQCRLQFRSATKAIISTGPFHFVEKETIAAPLHSDAQLGDAAQIPGAETMQSDDHTVVAEDQPSLVQTAGPGAIGVQESGVNSEAAVSEGNEIPETQLEVPPGVIQGVVVLSRRPAARLALWLPERLRMINLLTETDMSPSLPDGIATASKPTDARLNNIQSDLPAMDEEHPWSPRSKKSGRKVSNDILSDAEVGKQLMVDGWPIPVSLEKSALLEESKRKRWGMRPEMLDKDLGSENSLNEVTQNKDHGDAEQSDMEPVIRSRVEFSKGVDGSQMLSYEEEVIKREDKPKMQHLGEEIVQRTGRRAFFTFLDLLRTMSAD